MNENEVLLCLRTLLKPRLAQLGVAEKASFGNFAAAEKVALRDSLKAALREEAGEAEQLLARRAEEVAEHAAGVVAARGARSQCFRTRRAG